MQVGELVHGTDACPDLREGLRVDQIGLVQQDRVGESDLFLGLVRILDTLEEVPRIDDRHHRIERDPAFDVLVDEKGLHHGRGIGEAGGLDDDAVEPVLARHQGGNDANEIAAHGAADTSVVHFEHFLIGIDDEVVIDAFLAELVDDDGVFPAVLFAEDAIEQGGLAGAEIAGQHRHRYA